MFSIVLFIFVITSIARCNEVDIIDGYYWREYAGVIPKDAFPAGRDYNHKPIYIGQTLHQNEIIPGKIYTNKKELVFEWRGQERNADNNVKILCSGKPKNFEWIQRSCNEINGMSSDDIVFGGYKQDHSVYIGRMHYAGETTVGKIICGKKSCSGLHITKDGYGIEQKKIIEILSYNQSSTCYPLIDVRFLSV